MTDKPGVTLVGVCQTTRCNISRSATEKYVSDWLECDRQTSVTLIGVCQTTDCNVIASVIDQLVSLWFRRRQTWCHIGGSGSVTDNPGLLWRECDRQTWCHIGGSVTDNQVSHWWERDRQPSVTLVGV